MADLVTLSCPSCGGPLEIASGIDRFACAHCGNEHMVKRGGGVVTLAPVIERLEGIRRGVDKTVPSWPLCVWKGRSRRLSENSQKQ